MFFGGYFEEDAQTWFGSQINRNGGASDFFSDWSKYIYDNSRLIYS